MLKSQLKRYWIPIALLGMFLLSFFLRWQYIKNTEIIKPIRADAYQYVVIASNLATHGKFTSANPPLHSTQEARPPGYCFFLASIFKVTDNFQEFYRTTLWIQSLLGSLTVLMTYFIARFLLAPGWSILAALLMMISPHMIVMSAYFLSESLYVFLQTLAILLLLYAIRRDSLLLLATGAVTLGTAIFVRPVLGVFPFIAAGLIFHLLRKSKPRNSIIIMCALTLLLSLAPQTAWVIWKTSNLSKDTQPVSALKVALLSGVYPNLTYKRPELKGMPYRDDPEWNRIFESGYFGIAGSVLTRFRQEPFENARWWIVGKPVMFWSWKVFFSDGINFYPVKRTWFDTNKFMSLIRGSMITFHFVFVIFALIGSILFWRRTYMKANIQGKFCYLLLLGLAGHFTLIFMVLAPFPRYSLPLALALYILFTLALKEMWELYSLRGKPALISPNSTNRKEA